MATVIGTIAGNETLDNNDVTLEDLPFDSLVARAVCVSFVMVLALAGNTIIIAVIVRTEALRNITGLFLVNLAIADLCVILFTMPFIIDVAIWGQWRFTESWCTACGFLEELFTAASIATLALISYDRYVAIVKPLHYQQLITPLRAGLVLVYIWFHSTVLASLPLFNFAEYSYVRDVGACTVNWKTATLGLTIAINLFCYFIPLAVILICYSKIFIVARKVKRQVKPSNQARHPSVPERSYVEVDNFSVPANFGINHEKRSKTITFRGNLQIAESIQRIKSASAAASRVDKSIRDEIIEEKDVEEEEHLNGSKVKRFIIVKFMGNSIKRKTIS
ncbi:G-protein coupled receptor 161-like [Amphiura filiformis]|uniref:G-protein coupled receptor 161-like n=1 Tax=Amphiura filiformis TaxID=82378 RepID=UPI003B21D444